MTWLELAQLVERIGIPFALLVGVLYILYLLGRYLLREVIKPVADGHVKFMAVVGKAVRRLAAQQRLIQQHLGEQAGVLSGIKDAHGKVAAQVLDLAAADVKALGRLDDVHTQGASLATQLAAIVEAVRAVQRATAELARDVEQHEAEHGPVALPEHPAGPPP
jgi:hypothetical protein